MGRRVRGAVRAIPLGCAPVLFAAGDPLSGSQGSDETPAGVGSARR